MKLVLSIAGILVLSGSLFAMDLGNRSPADAMPVAAADQAVIRQGGDTFADAVPISFPYQGYGHTDGYTDDYDETCPSPSPSSPDVVYTFTGDTDLILNVDLQGSSFDTKLYIYNANLNLVACNDDYHHDWTSRLETVFCSAGSPYYIVIDGHAGASGDYIIDAYLDGEHFECPDGGVREDEPPLSINYVDNHNGGCNTNPPVFQTWDHSILCGVAGHYRTSDGSEYRDTDWFIYTMPEVGFLQLGCMGDEDMYFSELGPPDCENVDVIQYLRLSGDEYGEMTILGEPGSDVWVWAGSQHYSSPGGYDADEFGYVIEVLNPVVVKQHSLSSIKSLFR